MDYLANAGLNDFYRGDLARSIAVDLESARSPLKLVDLERHHALMAKPLEVDVAVHRISKMPPPTQGLASLILLAVYARRNVGEAESFDFVHTLVEETKRAFLIRDAHITDPAYMSSDAASYLKISELDTMAANIEPQKVMPWPNTMQKGDTVWLGAADAQGCELKITSIKMLL